MLTDHKRIPRYLMASITCLLIMISFIPSLPYVKAHSSVFLYGYTNTTPTIDGNVNIGGGEWSDADTATFVPLSIGIQTITGTLYMMNNDTYLFIAVIINGDDDFDSYDGMQIDFDNDNGGGTNRAVGDD
ncbi:hypothetical protein, partial [[Eubacterium] cellulosolvens]